MPFSLAAFETAKGLIKMAQIKPLPDDFQEIATRELGEVTSRIPEDLEDLKSWIEQQPHLKACTDDQFLVQFLRGSKYSLEKAKRKIDQFYTLRTKYPEFLLTCDVDEPIFRKIHNTSSGVVLPTPLNGNGPRIVYLRPNFAPDDFTATSICQYMFTLVETLLLSDSYACVHGFIFLIDNTLTLVSHFTTLVTPNLVSKIFSFMEKAFPIRIKGIYFFNISPVVEKLAKLLLPYIPEKIRNRVHFCGNNLEDLRDYVPKKYFPQDCGGGNGSVDDLVRDYNKVWDEYREYFRRNSEFGTDESLRCGESYQIVDEFGVGGSFRKLNVD
uniref:CRAL-TRIO domain-containing protein n=1 Tax=Stomoxys calcitrans TaxID=35570 RepID=A0A1I8P560_STOCA